MFGIMSSRPCEAVNVVVSAPPLSEPCTAPAAPPSLCISAMRTCWPNRLSLPLAAQSSATSAMGDDGVIG